MLAEPEVIFECEFRNGAFRRSCELDWRSPKTSERCLRCPVYDLLVGRTRDALRPYLTGWGAELLEKYDIRDVKVAMPFAPAGGKAENKRLIAARREAVGSDGFIALDSYMGWDVPYTLDMARRLKDYNIYWIEEPVMPKQVQSYRNIVDSVDCMVTGGEHCYTLESLRRLIVDGGLNIMQPDVYRAGGHTLLKKVAATAETYGRKLICHGVGLPTYHFLISNSPIVSPCCEFLDVYAGSGQGWVLLGEPYPVGGTLELPDVPGLDTS